MKQLVVYNHKSDEIGVRIGEKIYEYEDRFYFWNHVVEHLCETNYLTVEDFNSDYIILGWL